MDEDGPVPSRAGRYDEAAMQTVHRATLLSVIAAAVAVCGFGLQAFLGHLGTASADVGSASVAPPPTAAAAAGTGSDTFRLPPPADVTPGPDQQASFLVAVQNSGTGGWSTRFDLVRYGLDACRLLSTGAVDADVVEALVAKGEGRAQARAVVESAPQTLCPPDAP